MILRAITSHLIAAQASRVRDRDVARVLNYETDTRQQMYAILPLHHHSRKYYDDSCLVRMSSSISSGDLGEAGRSLRRQRRRAIYLGSATHVHQRYLIVALGT